MKLFRTVLFWMHLCAGLFAAIVVVIMSVTGVLLTYELQLQQWEAGGTVAVPASPENERLPPVALASQHQLLRQSDSRRRRRISQNRHRLGHRPTRFRTSTPTRDKGAPF